ncbi:ABC transporter substrate-binding protein [Roseovarius pelagicus]|uniref:ABC transporter substrate-binding protein n=1 Tax=Roseovarius pelagicus TaxID=2980108 RepID=A0ABY6D8Z0_9RHOB|nr:ABC transporter substrate-binding protein [Roseovarius pelagicus]UXX81538.1 ABC transporter substrate-binding protein [Roseovarius pelagicus]
MIPKDKHRRILLVAIASSVLGAAGLTMTTGYAAAQEGCVEISGTDPIKETQTMDPAFLWGDDDAMHIWSVYEPLIHLDETFQPMPRLAESWEANADATQWTFHLRKGVKFHDGSAFAAKDAVYSINRLTDPNVASPAAPAMSFMEGAVVEAVDDHTLSITTQSPVVELPVLLSSKFALMVKDGTPSTELAQTANGTGAFMAPDYVRAADVRKLVANPDYWDPELPKSDCLLITVKTDPLAMTAGLLSNEVDYAPVIDGSTARSLQKADNVELLASKQGSFLTFAMWTQTPPFDDVRVRQALKLVIDRQVMVNAALLGFGVATNDHNIPPFFPTAAHSTVPEQDIERARELLKEAGYEDDLEIDLFSSEIQPGLTKMSTLFAQMASQAGVKVNVVTMPSSSFWDEVWNKRPFYTSSWGLRSTADGLSVAHRSDAGWNETQWQREDYDALLDKAAQTVDPKERTELYRQAQIMLEEEGGTINPVMATAVAAVSKDCGGVRLYATQTPDFRYLYCDR